MFMILSFLIIFLSTPSARRATPGSVSVGTGPKNFYPRPPRGGRPLVVRLSSSSKWYFYPRPPRGGRPGHRRRIHGGVNFYPRPPRGGRRPHVALFVLLKRISIHALREEGDVVLFPAMCGSITFLSTPSARRATAVCRHRNAGPEISIHALREEGDFPSRRRRVYVVHFYPRPPRGGRHGKSAVAVFWV